MCSFEMTWFQQLKYLFEADETSFWFHNTMDAIITQKWNKKYQGNFSLSVEGHNTKDAKLEGRQNRNGQRKTCKSKYIWL